VTRGVAAPIAPEHLERFRDLVREQSGIDLPSQRLPELERAVRKVMEETEEPDPGRLASLLGDRSDDLAGLESLVGHITVGETYFFRHPQQFEAVERWILPELVDARRDVRRLRVWSAGCATGEEAFSSAILLDRLAPTLGGWNTTIVATDIDRGALETARRGRYRSWSFRGIPAGVLQAYFDPAGPDLEISRRLRDMVRFEHHNLIEDPHPTLLLDANAVDLILCRNVLMYLTPDAIARVGDRLVTSLADGGWLLLGPSDPRPSALEGLTRHLLGDTVIAYRKESSRALGPPAGAAAAAVRTRAPMPSATVRHANPTPERDSHAEWAKDPGIPIDAEALCAEAATLAGLGDLEEAELRVRLALDLDPLLPIAHHVHGLILDERGDPQGALGALRRCTYLDPRSAIGHLALAGLHGRLGGSHRALRELEVVRELVAGRPADELVPGGDGLTVDRVLELVEAHRSLYRSDPRKGNHD